MEAASQYPPVESRLYTSRHNPTMNLDNASRYLQINRSTLDRWIRQGLLANAGLRGERFDERVLASWARRHGISVKAATRPAPQTSESLLSDAIQRGAVQHGVQAADASTAIKVSLEALNLASSAHHTLLEETLERERLAATSLGHGIAIPHPRRPPGDLLEEPLISVAFLATPLGWEAVDGRPVHTVFLLLSPNTKIHLQLLSRIAIALRAPNMEEFLQSQPDGSTLVERLASIQKPS